MKHICLAVVFGFISILAQAQQKQIHILHSSDTHSRIEPIETTSSDIDAGLGGVERRYALISAYRAEHPEVLVLDCGDFSQGTPYYNLYQGEAEVSAMNLMGYDAATIGNHEFDFGLENMARLYRLARFPIVCANYDVTGTVLEGLVHPYVVIEREGVKIGIFGLAPRLEGLVQLDKYEGVVYSDPVAAAQKVVNELREREQVDVVICLSHLGILSEDDSSDKSEYDNTLAVKTSGIDLILGGHTHTRMETPHVYSNAVGEVVPVMHIGKSGCYLSRSILTVESR